MTRELRLVSSSLLLWGVGEGLFFYFQPLYLQQLGANPLEIGGILGLASLGLVVTHIPAGALADKLGRRTLMRASWSLGTLATGMMFLAPSLPFFVAGLIFYYFTAFVMAPLSSYITAARGKWTVARALTTVYALYAVGSILGPIVGGQLGKFIGLRALYGISASLFVVSTIVMLFLPEQPTESTALRSNLRQLLGKPSFGRLIALFLISNFALLLCWPLTPNYLQNERGVGLTNIGIFGSINALGGVVLNLVLGRMQSRAAFLLTQLLVGASAMVLWLGTGMPWFAMGYFLFGAYRTARSIAIALAETQVEPPQMGLAYGLVETTGGLAQLAAAPIAGLLYRAAPFLPYPVGITLTAASLLLSGRWLPTGTPLADPTKYGRE